jgi:hypothetical protein
MNLKKTLRKKCLIMGVSFGLSYSIFMTLAGQYGETLTENLLYFAGMAVFSGPLFGLLMYWVLSQQQKVVLKHFPALAQKTILLVQNGARIFETKPKAVAGWYYLTEDSLYFAAEAKKFADLTMEIPLYRIQTIRVETFNRQECLQVHLTDGNMIRLGLGNVNAEWAIKLSEAIQKLQTA